MSNLRWVIGASLLALALGFGLYGLYASYSQAEWNDEVALFVADPAYTEECGDCHLAYPPGLLPAQSWQAMMQGLDDHFGDNAELDADTAAHIHDYLQGAALAPGAPGMMRKMLRNLPATAPIRITELPYFISAHRPIAGFAEQQEMSLGNCEGCHVDALSGRFREPLSEEEILLDQN